MMIMPGNDGGVWLGYFAGKYPGRVGRLVSPRRFKRPVPFLPWAMDNDCFAEHHKGLVFDEIRWMKCLDKVMGTLRPMWVLCPDVVGSRDGTITRWEKYSSEIVDRGLTPAFAVQDGMLAHDVPAGAKVVFVGGSTKWKWKSVKMWCSSFPKVHVGRGNELRRLLTCERLGAESCDGSGWFRDPSDQRLIPRLEMFLSGHRTPQTEFGFTATH